MKHLRRALRGPGQGKYVLLSAIVLAMFVAPFAVAVDEGQPLDGGTRNPRADQSQAYSAETEIIAQNNSYGTRQSNKTAGDGGGAIYGCRSNFPANGKAGTETEPCLRANNLEKGRAFEFNSNEGKEVGRITVGNDASAAVSDARPFTTNATAVATGLNADAVDGRDASDLEARYAQVNENGTASQTQGVATANNQPRVSRQAEGDYEVVFTGNLTSCGFSATAMGTQFGTVTFVPAATENNQTTTVDVRTWNSAGNAADRGFHLVANC